MTPVVPLKELGAMVTAYPPGKRLPVYVKAGNAPKELVVGAEVEVAESVRLGTPQGARATGRVVGVAWIVEVTLPEDDALPLVDEDQGDLLGGAA